MPAETNSFGKAIPVFRVESVAAAIDYYVGILGFHIEWSAPDFASVSRDKCNIFLCEGDQGHPGTWVWVGVNDVAALETELRAKGAKIRHPPTNYPWALEIQVEDLDGNVLRLGSDSIQDQPFGEWLDMDGRAWPLNPGA
jgi:catechol 2,3-dioxygenase-like lactoylglutathione lyase family enzyme